MYKICIFYVFLNKSIGQKYLLIYLLRFVDILHFIFKLNK